MSDLGPRPFRRRALWILLALSFVMSLRALKGDILAYDDASLLLGPDGAVERGFFSLFTRLYYYAYLPFYGLSYWVEGLFGGTTPWVFHLGNVLWHAATSYVVFCVLGALLRNRTAALFGAILFAVHPLHVESVAWIAGRKELVSGFFLFLAWLLFLRDRTGWAVVSFLVACFAKATAVVLPGLLLAAALLLPRHAGRRKKEALRTIPFFVFALAPVAVHLLVAIDKGVVRDVTATGDRVLSGVYAWGWSLARTLAPVDLSIDYPEARDVGGGALLLPALLLAGALAALVAFRRRAPEVSFGIAAFLVALAPFNNVFPATDVFAADRYLYLPLFGAAAVVGWAAGRWHRAAVATGVVAAGLTVLSFLGSARFGSDEALWTRTIEARDASAVAYVNRGLSRVGEAMAATPLDDALLDKGVEDLERALSRAVLPEHRAKASLGLALPLRQRGRLAEGFERATDALDLTLGSETADARAFRAQALYHRGLIRNDLGDAARAATDFASSAELRPRFEAWYECGRALVRTGRVAEAKAALGKAADFDPENPWPWLDMARIGHALHDRQGQREALREASRRAPRAEEVVAGWVNYWLDDEAPDYGKARKELERLPEGSPRRRRLAAEVDAQRALFHFRRGNAAEALEAADTAVAAGLTNPSMLYELGQVYMERGRYDDAVGCFRGATDVLEQRRAYRDAVARAYAMKAYRTWVLGDEAGALAAMRLALDARPSLIEFGAAPLRAEIDMLREASDERLLLLAAAAVAGDPVRARGTAEALLEASLPDRDRRLVYRLRALSNTFVSFDFAAAEDDLGLLLAADPQDRWARYRLAQVWVRSGVGWLRTGRQIGSEERQQQGRELLRKAIDLLGALLQEDPDFHVARLQRGEAHFALRDDVGAKADYQQVRERDGSVKEAYLKEAVLHRLVYVEGGQRANLETAIRMLGEALRLDPNYFDALYELGNVYHHLYDRQEDGSLSRKRAFADAIRCYRRAMALNPRQKEPRVEWARICIKAAREAAAGGKVRAAHELVERVEAEAADVPDVHRERAWLNLREDFGAKTGLTPDETFSAAGKALAELERLSPDDPELPKLSSLFHRTRGWSFYLSAIKLRDEAQKARARELAVEEWTKALEAWPEDPDHRSIRDRLREIAPEYIEFDQERAKDAFARGAAAFEEQRFPDAVAAFREALSYFPESAHLRYNLGVALARAGRLDDAREELQGVANGSERARFPEALWELGKLCLVKMERPTARVWFERHIAAMEEAGRGEEETVIQARKLLAELE